MHGSLIHLDEEFAKAAGLPGVIVHGLAGLAIATRAVLSAAKPAGVRDLSRLSCRFRHPVGVNDALTTRVWRHDGGSDSAVSTRPGTS